MTQLSLDNLNEQQAAAVAAVDGPVLVLAGPGSGKTRVLTSRIAYLIDERGIAPWNILAVTFTNKAAREMRERVERLLGERFGEALPGQPPRLGGLTIGTFHSICARVLRIETDAVGYARNWVIYDTADQLALIRSLLRELNLDEKRYSPSAIRARIGKWKNELIGSDNTHADSYFDEIAGRVYARFQEALQINNAMDFDDLLFKTVTLLRSHEDLLVKYQHKWRYLLVDEFQDTNTAQYELLRLLVNEPAGERHLFVVGDEDQSVYRFRGADYRNVLRFREDYPAARVILLEQNYRSSQTILDIANALISHNRNRTPKKLHTDNGQGLAVNLYEAYNEIEEAAYVCDEIERLTASRSRDYGDFAVMYRTNAQSRALEEVFVMRQIKYKLIGATRFYERREIKDALHYLRLVHNPADTVAMDRVINTPARGIGAKTYAALKMWAADIGVSEYKALRILHHGAETVAAQDDMALPDIAFHPPLGTRAQNALVAFSAMLEDWIHPNQLEVHSTVADLFDKIMHDSGYVDALRDGSDDGEERFANLQELRGVTAQYGPGMVDLPPDRDPLSMLLEEISLVSDADQVDETGGAVTLMTLHTAKGLEYPTVFIVGLEDGILPHQRSIESEDDEDMEEERRLFYVGITRAKRRLYLLHTFRRSLWGTSEVQQPSRFLDELPTQALTGMVDRHSRRARTTSRAASWESGRNRREGQRKFQSDSYSDRNSRRSSSAYDWSESRSTRPVDPRETSWSSQRPPVRRTKARKQSSSTAQKTKYKRRDSVEHPQFGVGTVIESNLVAGDEEITVAFPGVGIKRLVASIANLKKL